MGSSARSLTTRSSGGLSRLASGRSVKDTSLDSLPRHGCRSSACGPRGSEYRDDTESESECRVEGLPGESTRGGRSKSGRLSSSGEDCDEETGGQMVTC